jgi:methyl-accepting chemotaxis protein
MVFLFGYDVPIVEVIFGVTLFSILTLILLLVSLHRSKQINKKLDKIMGEEKEFKQELDIAKQEEDQQLALIRTIVKEMHTLTQINRDEHEGMAAVQRLAKKASRHIKVGEKGHPELKNALDELSGYIASLEKVSSKENRQLETINRIVSRIKR